jgi:hypothetical protein
MKPVLEEGGEHHNFICVGCQNVLTNGRTHDLGENGSRQTCKSQFHQQQTTGTGAGAGARWPWQGKRIAASLKMELAWRRRAQKNSRRNSSGGRTDWVPDPITF